MSSWESQLTSQEVEYYKQLFKAASKSQEGIVTGSEAVQFFASSGIPNQLLSEIWEAADRDKVGYLTPETFAIALKLIACTQHGKEANTNVLSTVVPFPQFEGVNVVVSSPSVFNTPLLNSSTSLTNSPITKAEREKYISIFKVHQPVNGVLDANTAKSIFLKSNLSMETLSQIWYLADVRQSGALNQTEFIIAMHYIAKLMDGTLTNLPDKLPPTVYQSALNGNTSTSTTQSPIMRNMSISSPSFRNARQQSIMTPPQRARTIESLGDMAFGSSAPIYEPIQQWDVTAQEKQQYDIYFDKIDSNKTGVVQGKEAVEFFKNSRLPESELAFIWDLADIQQRGALSRNEFAIAMHLIHKRLAGENLPQVLPKTLIPPQKSNNIIKQSPQQSRFGNSPLFTPNNTISSTPQQTHSLIDNNANNDLLGDFGNDQVSHETNQVNLMQNQIVSLTSQTSALSTQKLNAENTLEQLSKQKRELEAQLTSIRMTHEAAVKDLNEIQETIRQEESQWEKVQAEYNAAQQQLNEVQNEITQTKQTLENGRAETESLRRRVHEIQEQITASNAELDKLRAQTKQQNMMLDINKRQVTAAEQDRALARRHLEDYKTAGDLNKDESDSDDDDDDNDGEEERKTSVFGDVKDQSTTTNEVLSPNETSSVNSTPALDDTFKNPPAPTPISPFTEFTMTDKSANVFNAFSPTAAINNVTNQSDNNSSTPISGDDFDAIFGVFNTPSNTNTTTTTPANAFDPSHWATNSITTPSLSHTKSSRGPPPPPPQSRHHRQPSESVSSVVSAASPVIVSTTKKQRAPPPPPPPQTTSTTTIDSYIAQDEQKDNDGDDDDDFEAAFSGKQLPEAKIVNKDDELAEFDEAFQAFDIKPAQSATTTHLSSATNKNNWASSFGGFNFSDVDNFTPKESTTTPAVSNDEDWDAIFGATSSNDKNTTPNTSTINHGFDDAFSSFSTDFGKQSTESKKPDIANNTSNNNMIGIVGDKIEELVKMGFNEKEAKDALNRYDQDLEKASNFLLDQSSKQ
ncbi:uncharacterized protein BX663DRAFT_428252 [Cokeromyces recurvatus]|uniref:uncharacterized protein n=1 Tax=Cokeromyces recurvatus TaxID=90255 RepID=UPI00221F8ED9|nr:uncharacterized protein BX663DRAFT_428252 [Cokeromyces recurvatus]KAI7906003.1 hypothetical protein BX663DRAFT_428252 [Cokeromyces recurvatus]